MRNKLVLLGLTLVLLALALCFVRWHGTNQATIVASDPAPGAPASATVAADSVDREQGTRITASLPAAGSSVLHVHSSAGIPLAFVEIERDGGWKRHAMVKDSVDGFDEQLPTQVRAPGHVARVLESMDGELVLEPDALLLIEGQHLRSCLAELAIEEGACREDLELLEARTRAVVADWISDTCFGIAVACDRLEPLSGTLQAGLVRADRQRSFLTLQTKRGLRGRWEMPCESLRPGSPLEVRVERPAGLRGALTVVLDCPAEPGSGRPQTFFPWGGVGGSSRDLSEEVIISASEELARFSFALQGRQLSVAAIDGTTGAYGRIEFVHDGSWRMLELRPALEIRGRVVEAGSRKPLKTVYLLLKGVSASGWIIEAQGLKLDASGGFVLHGPTRALVNRSVSLDPPDSFSVSAQAPGFDHCALTIERTDARLLDLGELVLVRHKNPTALAAGHGVDPAALDGQALVFADKPQELWLTIPAVALDDGRLEFEFRATAPSDPHMSVASLRDLLLGSAMNVAFERPLGEVLFVHVVDDVRTFRLEADALYHRVPEDSLELTLRTEALPAAGGSWKIGWTWDGAWIGVGQLASAVVGSEVQARITVPHGAQQIWWSSNGIPPDLRGDPGGSQAITGSLMKVVLR